MKALLLAPFLLLSTACLESFDPLDPMVGPPLVERCSNVDSDPNTEVSFSRDIQPILQAKRDQEPGCNCHMPSDPNPIGLEATGLDLSNYSGLIRGGINTSANLVVAGQPCESVLWKKISAGPPFGARMPFNGPPFLSSEAIQTISDWIAEGARDN